MGESDQRYERGVEEGLEDSTNADCGSERRHGPDGGG